MTGNRLLGLDTLRGVAVLSVLAYHYLNNTSVLRTPTLLPVQQFSEHLFFGVDLFFVISGFVIGLSLIASKGKPGYFSSYFLRRSARIFPLYYGWLAIFVLAALADAKNRGASLMWLFDLERMPLAPYFTFTQNFAAAEFSTWGPAWLGITWTLAIEVQFYALAAVIVYATPARLLGLVSLAVISAAALYKVTNPLDLSGHALMTLTHSRLDAPFVGVFCAWLWASDRFRAWVNRHAVALKRCAVAAMAAHYVSINYGLVSYPISSLTANAVVFGFAVIAFASDVGPAANSAVNGLRWCGVRCYSIYLTHVGVLGLTAQLIVGYSPNVFSPGEGWPVVSIACVATLCLAGLSWRWLEHPAILWASIKSTRENPQPGGQGMSGS